MAEKEQTMEQPPKTSLRRRASGLYELRFMCFGKQRSVYGRTQQEVFLKYKKQKPKRTDKPCPDFEAFTKIYFEEFKRGQISEVTYKYQFRKAEMYLFPKLGKQKLRTISALDLQKTVNAVKLTRTRQDCFNLLNEIMRTAKQLKLIKENPMEILKRPKHQRQLGAALTAAEEKTFLESIKGHKLEGLLKFLLYTGARRNEGINFRLSDIDAEKNEIRLRGTKTALSDRRIPFFDDVKAVLKDFSADWGSVRGDMVTRAFKDICPSHKLHDLRHTFATRCLERGVSMKTVQIWLGHSTYEQTANTYSHVTNDFEQKEAEKINRPKPIVP